MVEGAPHTAKRSMLNLCVYGVPLATYINEGRRRPVARRGAPWGESPPPFSFLHRGERKERERERERGAPPPPLVQFGIPWGGASTPCGPPLSPLRPTKAQYFPREVPVTPRYSGKISESLGTIPMSEYNLPIYESLPLAISRLLVVSVISSGSPKKLRSPKHITHNTNRHQTVSVWTLRVRELCRHDQDTSPTNNQ